MYVFRRGLSLRSRALVRVLKHAALVSVRISGLHFEYLVDNQPCIAALLLASDGVLLFALCSVPHL